MSVTRTINYTLPKAKHDTTYHRITFDITPQTAEYDLTNAELKLQVQKKQIGSQKYELQVQVNSAYQFEIPKQLISLEAGLYQYDVLFVYPNRTVRYVAGELEVEPTITEIV